MARGMRIGFPAGSALATSAFKVNENPVSAANLTAPKPALGALYVEPSTGATARRMTNGAAMGNSLGNAYNYYTRYSAENITGQYLLTDTGASTASKVIRRSDLAVVATISFGAFHEVRWHMGTDHPNRVYYVTGTEFRYIEDVVAAPTVSTLIVDVGATINWAGTADNTRRIFCGQEGTSSADSNRWVWMATFYDGVSTNVRAFVSYEISSGTLRFFYPSDLTGLANIPTGEAARTTFSTFPNCVEALPDGSGALIMTDRAYAGHFDSCINTILGSPHVWPFDLYATTPKSTAPFRAMCDSTHSGYAYLGGVLGIVHQDNRRDKWTWVPMSGANKGYGSTTIGDPFGGAGVNFAGIVDFYNDGTNAAGTFDNTYEGVHFGRTGPALDGWCLESTYDTAQATANGHANNVFLRKIVPIGASSRVWNITPAFNLWPPANKQDYNESIAAGNMAMWSSTGQPMRIHVPGDWWGAGGGDAVDVYEIEIPSDWAAHM